MAQLTWHVGELTRIAATLIALSPSEDFTAGVLALAHAVGADVPPPRRRDAVAVVVIDAAGAEVPR